MKKHEDWDAGSIRIKKQEREFRVTRGDAKDLNEQQSECVGCHIMQIA